MTAGPMCRVEIEADSGASMEKLVPSLSGPWRCPGCREERTAFSCSACDVRRNVILAAEHTALAFFEAVDALFFDFLGHHERRRRGQPASVQELQMYFLRIDFLLSSANALQLQENSWMVREAVEHLLAQAYRGAQHFSFSAPYMDNNSKALYVLLVDKLKIKLEVLNLSSLGITFDLPDFIARGAAGDERPWSCPVCSKESGADCRACELCGCDKKALIIAESHDEMQNVSRVFAGAESLVFRALDVMCDRHASDGVSLSCSAALDVLRKEANVFLQSLDVRRLELAGWKIKCHLAALFEGLCRQEEEVPFRYYCDVTSAGLYAVLVRRLRFRLARDAEVIPEYSRFSFAEPRVSTLLRQDEEYETLSSQRFHVHGQTFGLLQSQRKLFIMTAHLIAQRAGELFWVIFIAKIFILHMNMQN